jgi:uncharacterized membrane protein (UPF0182 family)
MYMVIVVLANMLWLYYVGFNGIWFTVIVTVIFLATVAPKRG